MLHWCLEAPPETERVWGGLCTEALDLLEASAALVNHHNTDGTRSVSLLAWEHAAKVHKFPESPKSPSKIPCLSEFQVGHPLGNVKTAEVRTHLHSCIVTFLLACSILENNSINV